METPETLETSSTNWPPVRGWPLFLAWMGGVLAVALFYVIIPMTGMGLPRTTAGWNQRIIWMLPALAGHAWQAWLLFRRYPVRLGLWTALPLVQLIASDSIRFIQYMSLVIPLLEAAILRNVRQRAWAWIFASMAGVVFSALFTYFAYNAGQSFITKVMNEIGSNFGPSAGGVLQMGLFRGVWLLGEALCAWVLAWKMPPVKPPFSEPMEIHSISADDRQQH
jgi:hypothetical protein